MVLQQMKMVECDGGLAKSSINDDNNCVVRAIAIAYGLSYKKAYDIAAAAGRKHAKGAYTENVLQKSGLKYTKFVRHLTINQFLKSNPQGRFIATRRGHAFAIINGTIYDSVTNKKRQIINKLFQVESLRIKEIRAAS